MGAVPARTLLPTLALVLPLLAACEDEERGAELQAAAELAAPFGERFATFDRWARRGVLAAPVRSSRESIEETMFAPIRRDPDLVGVWVVREGGRDVRITWRTELTEPPEGLRWLELRELLGGVRVAVGELPDSRVSSGDRPDVEAVFLEREDSIEGGASVRVVLAYALRGERLLPSPALASNP